MNPEHIEKRKRLSDYKRRAEAEAKLSYCVLCGQRQTSFCNSHSVPRMVLKRIAQKGEVLVANSLIEFELLDVEDGKIPPEPFILYEIRVITCISKITRKKTT